MVKDLNHYMSLRYEIVVREMSAEDGGGVFLYIPTLGGGAINAWGATYSEARHILEEVKKDYFNTWIMDGVYIPEPEEW